MDNTSGISRMLNTKDIMKIFGIGKNGANALMRSNTFPSIQIGRKWLISEDALKRWLEDNEYSSIIIE